MKSPAHIFLSTLLTTLVAVLAAEGQTSRWQLGGSGHAWSESDSVQIMVDFTAMPGSIRPRYITPDQNILQLVPSWHGSRSTYDPASPRDPEQRLYRIWKADGNYSNNPQSPFQDVLKLVDGDPWTHSRPVTESIGSWVPNSGIVGEWYTLDLVVPVPAHSFGLSIPTQGYRTDDGLPYLDYIVPSFEVSVSRDRVPAQEEELSIEDDHPLERMIAEVDGNVKAEFSTEFPPRYVRYLRYKRRATTRDVQTTQVFDHIPRLSGHTGPVLPGVIGEFELTGQGVPERAHYLSKIFDLGRLVNIGRISWAPRQFSVVDGIPVEKPGAEGWLKVEIRVGRTPDPLA